MDRRLFDAAYSGNVEALHLLMQEDLLILARIPTGCAETPLHIACMLGHVDFAREILRLHPSFSLQLNQDGCSPLHLASANGHLEMVKLLLEFGHLHSVVDELCMKKDKDERISLHCAVIRGRIDVMSELLAACLESAMEVTVQRDTILHLAVKNNQCEAFLFLVQGQHTEALINLADNEGNTIVHLAAVRKQLQIIRFLESQPSLDMNAVNSYGLTALDLSLICTIHSNDLEIGEIIRRAGGERSQNQFISPAQNLLQVQPRTSNTVSGHNSNNNSSYCRLFKNTAELEEEINNMTNGILVMASLVATVTFQVAVNPPGGFWQDGDSSPNLTSDVHKPGTAILYDRVPDGYSNLISNNTQAFISSLCLIMILLFPVLPKFKYFSVYYLILSMIWKVVLVFLQAVQFTTKWYPAYEPLLTFMIPWCMFFGLWIGDKLRQSRGN